MKIELVIDGKKIPMNAFVSKVFINVIGGVIECLHGIDTNWKTVSLKLEKDE
ncbi:MAG: hypothetical protein PHD41_03600 [Methanosarcinaceae archaeon]|nr:hypothetical protein [Methanosarcinaceae archaeon]MDD4748808.1 hypothetical protein [Methanosarcinaceae archaeon]